VHRLLRAKRAKVLSRLQDPPPHLPALVHLLLVVDDRLLRHRCDQSQQVFHRVQSAHLGLRPPVGALALLARRAAPACQLLRTIPDLLSPPGHPSVRARRRSGRPAGMELRSLVLGWRCCGTLDSSRCEDRGPPLYLRLAGLWHVLSVDIQRLRHGLRPLRAFRLYMFFSLRVTKRDADAHKPPELASFRPDLASCRCSLSSLSWWQDSSSPPRWPSAFRAAWATSRFRTDELPARAAREPRC